MIQTILKNLKFLILMPSAIHLLNIFLNYDMLENR